MRIAFVSVLLILTFEMYAQVDMYVADLSTLKATLQTTSSYKAQIKGGKLSYYQTLYEELRADKPGNPTGFTYFYNLSQLFFPLRDNHLGFYQVPDYSHFKDKEHIDSFIQAKEFLDYPFCAINIDSLKIQLAAKPADSIEGIYHYDQFYSIGLFKTADKQYMGIIIETNSKLWLKGQIAIHLYEYGPNLYKAIYGHPLYKNFIFQPVEKFRNQSLVNSFFYSSYSTGIYSKKPTQPDYINLPKGGSKFQLKYVSGDIQYLLIQSFQNVAATKNESDRFYSSIKDSLNAPYLILDLRNNEGGAEKEMRKYFKLLKDYVKTGHLLVLLNNGTLSQAEIFTLKLIKLKNVKSLGQTTKGMLSYGSNYGKRIKLPSGQFEVYPTDMNGGPALLQYEDVGIDPEIFLSEDRDWVEQVVELIRKM